MDHPRVISLSPWGTQILTDTGLDRWLVGISHRCKVPEKAGNLPVVTAPLEHISSLPENFLTRPQHFPTMVLSHYNVNTDQLAALKPSHIITETLSGICRIPLPDIESQLSEWLGFQVKVVHLSDASLRDIFASVKVVVESLGMPDTNTSQYEKCHKKLARTGKKMLSKKQQPLVGILVNYAPARFAGRYFSELIPMVGATPLNWPHDVWIPDPMFAYPPPHKIILANPDADLKQQKEKFQRNIPAMTQLWGPTCHIDYFPVDGLRFWDKSCSGLVTALETIGEIMLNDPKQETKKGSIWTTL